MSAVWLQQCPVWGLTGSSYNERAAETALEVAEDLKLPAEVVQKDANKLLRDTYVDDGTTGDSLGDVSCLIGHKLPNG